MDYPTMEEVNKAGHEQLARWWRFLPCAGEEAAGTHYFDRILDDQVRIIHRIQIRLARMGGITEVISKTVGWRE